MKLNLRCGNDIRTGYVNVDRMPQKQLATDVYRQGDISSLDWLTEHDTVDEIIAMDCLEYLPTNTIKQAITSWYQKLSLGGVMKIMVPDCFAIAQAFAQGQLSLEEYSTMILGTQNNNDNRLSVIDTTTLIGFLQDIGFTIVLKRYEGVAIYVEATK